MYTSFHQIVTIKVFSLKFIKILFKKELKKMIEKLATINILLNTFLRLNTKLKSNVNRVL